MTDQNLINQAWVAIAKATDMMADELAQAAVKTKDKNYSSACDMEATSGELKTMVEKMKSDYPHLFSDAP